jgi:squalene-hopene/tetraprenyl-beta-curcumene cyclase
MAYLKDTQNADGSWTPLWFGNERAPGDENRTYGTARTVIALADSKSDVLRKAIGWLLSTQNSDGGWGGAPGVQSSIEETALAVHALSATMHIGESVDSIQRGVQWLIQFTDRGTRISPAPIGLYFARLWYYEDLYPLIFATGALVRARIAAVSGVS